MRPRLHQKLLVAAALVAVLAAGGAAAGAAQSPRFGDVPPDHPAFAAVEWAVEVGVASGFTDGTFRPQRPLNRRHALAFVKSYYDQILQAGESPHFTRGHMMVLLKAINDGTLASFDTEPVTPDDQSPATDADAAAGAGAGAAGAAGGRNSRFGDVPPDHPAFAAVGWAVEAGVTAGYPDGTFRPQRPLNRRHALAFVKSYYDQILQAGESPHFTRGDMMVLLRFINDGTLASFDFDSFSAVAAGWGHNCGLDTNGTIACWGWNEYGQTDTPTGTYTTITAGGTHNCGLRTNGTVTCWGDNEFGQTDTPAGTYTTITAGGTHSCGLRTNGTVTCWGWNEWNQADAPAGTYTTITAGADHSCGLRTDGTVTCWGDNEFGQTDAPAGTYTTITAGGIHSCGVLTDGTVTCWGWNEWGQSEAPAGTP